MSGPVTELTLHIPALSELVFRQKMLSDPATMAYNAPWFPPDGCIDFPESVWHEWYTRWIGKEPERFYAYLRRESDGAFVGEVCWHRVPDAEDWEIGVVVFAPYRCQGYGRQGLKLLLERAFLADGLPCLSNTFEPERAAAHRIHREAGFREIDTKGGLLHLRLTKEEYLHG